ncbi:MAG: VF530 family protein [Providencia rettgeri]|uniref:VF530 family protein n=1 Tax=unclassified Providencia TaxID=2633465 RepID=UPI00234B6499|nr:VF530 family protein [Providencia sp. PROV164]
MSEFRSKSPLHGVTLEMQVNALVDRYGWNQLGRTIKINCFNKDPSIKSSLKFLRRTPWARTQVELLYLDMIENNSIDNTDLDSDDPWCNSRH